MEQQPTEIKAWSTPSQAELWLGSRSGYAMILGLQSCPEPRHIDRRGLCHFIIWSLDCWREEGHIWQREHRIGAYQGFGFTSWNIGKFMQKYPVNMARSACALTLKVAAARRGQRAAHEWHKLQAKKLKREVKFPFACLN